MTFNGSSAPLLFCFPTCIEPNVSSNTHQVYYNYWNTSYYIELSQYFPLLPFRPLKRRIGRSPHSSCLSYWNGSFGTETSICDRVHSARLLRKKFVVKLVGFFLPFNNLKRWVARVVRCRTTGIRKRKQRGGGVREGQVAIQNQRSNNSGDLIGILGKVGNNEHGINSRVYRRSRCAEKRACERALNNSKAFVIYFINNDDNNNNN